MRTLFSALALVLAAGTAPRAVAAAGAPPPAAPIFYCPTPMKAPPARACPAAGARRHHGVRIASHARRWSGHARRHVEVDRREDRGVSASQAWVYRYELERGGFHPWEVEGRGHRGLPPPPPPPMADIERHWDHHWSPPKPRAWDDEARDGDDRHGDDRREHGERQGPDEHRDWALLDGVHHHHQHMDRRDMDDGDYDDDDRVDRDDRMNRDERGDQSDREGGFHHEFHGDRYGAGINYRYERSSERSGGYEGGEIDGVPYGHAWGDWPRGDDGRWESDSERWNQGEGDADDLGGHHWRYGEGGGYEVYDYAGRDEDGYLVWSGKPRR